MPEDTRGDDITLASLQATVTSATADLTTLTTVVNTLVTSLETLTTTVASLTSRIEALEAIDAGTRLDALEGAHNALSDIVNSHTTDLDDLNTRLTTAEASIADHETRITALEPP